MPSFISRKYLKNPDPNTKASPSFWQWAGRFFMGVGILAFLSMILGVLSLLTLMSTFQGGHQPRSLPSEFALYYELKHPLPDTPSESANPLMAYLRDEQSISFLEFLEALEAAKTDNRVQELVIRLYEGQHSLAQFEEIRKAIVAFHEASGKKTRVITDNFGGFSNGMGEYWLATAFEEIWVQPLGMFSVTGLSIEQPYIKEALDNIGVEFQFEKRKDFKTAPETFTRNSMSRESFITLSAVADQFMEKFIADVAQSRQVEPDAIRQLINQSPMRASDAYKHGLIDYVAPPSELHDSMDRVGMDDERELKLVTIDRYQKQLTPKHKQKRKGEVAVISINGMILNDDGLSEGQAFAAPTDIVSARDIRRTISSLPKSVKVIVLRVNSPGGTPSGAEEIRQAILKARNEGKYIIVSMGDMAASGGYWVATDADHIVAADMTLTGSIGVYGGKPNLEDLWDKIGVSWGVIETGDNASMWSVNRPYSESERARLDYLMDTTYEAFIERVAAGRGLPIEEVEKVAQGRVWTGADAAKLNLVDEIGGFQVALHHAAMHLGVDDWRSLSISFWPREDDPFAELAELFELPFPFGRADIALPLQRFMYPEAIVTTPEFYLDF